MTDIYDTRPYYFGCPKCGQCEEFFTVDVKSSESAGCLVFLIAGFIPYLLFSSTDGPRALCASCGHVFSFPSRPITRLSFGVMLGWLVTALTGAFFFLGSLILALKYPDLESPFKSFVFGVTDQISDLISEHMGATLWALLGIAMASIVICMISNARYRSRLSEYYKFEPPYYKR